MNDSGYIVHINMNINVLMRILRLEVAHKLNEIVVKPIYSNKARIMIQHTEQPTDFNWQHDNQDLSNLLGISG